MHSRILTIAMVTLMTAPWSQAQRLAADRSLSKIDIVEHLGDRLPDDLTFVNESGDSMAFSEIMGSDKPVILTLAWYQCPMLCTLVLNGLSNGVQEIDWPVGDEFKLVTVSIDPTETARLAKSKGKGYRQAVNSERVDGWHFYTGDQSEITALADAVGFQYYYDEDTEIYAHPATAIIITPDGRISRYLYGLSFEGRELRLALGEAAGGNIGSIIDRIILRCYHYDPDAKGYVVMAGQVMRIGGFATVLILGTFLAGLWAWELRHGRHRQAA